MACLHRLTMNGETAFSFRCPECGESMGVNASMREALLDHGCVTCGAVLSSNAFRPDAWALDLPKCNESCRRVRTCVCNRRATDRAGRRGSRRGSRATRDRCSRARSRGQPYAGPIPNGDDGRFRLQPAATSRSDRERLFFGSPCVRFVASENGERTSRPRHPPVRSESRNS